MNQSSATDGRDWAVGVQSFTYRNHSVRELCAALSDTPVTAVELCHEHVLPDMAVDTVEDRLGQIEAAGLSVCGYGVVDFDGNPEDVEGTLDLVDRLDGNYLSLTVPPGDRTTRWGFVKRVVSSSSPSGTTRPSW